MSEIGLTPLGSTATRPPHTRPQPYKRCAASARRKTKAFHSSRPDVLFHREKLLELRIFADRVPDRIDFQARDGNGLTCRDREKFPQILHCVRGSTGLGLNLSQTGQVTGTKNCVLLRG